MKKKSLKNLFAFLETQVWAVQGLITLSDTSEPRICINPSCPNQSFQSGVQPFQPLAFSGTAIPPAPAVTAERLKM